MNRPTTARLALAAVLAGGLLAAPIAPALADTGSTTTASSHGTGLDLDSIKRVDRTVTTGHMGFASARTASLPSSASLASHALTPGDQGRVNSCVAWATGYTGYGILMDEQGISGAPMAPMFTYAQIAQGYDNGTNAEVALGMQVDQGIDTHAHYTQGDYDFTTQPTQSERANAAHYKLSGYESLPTSGSAAKTAIMQAIASGSPVPIGMRIHSNFQDMDSQTARDYSYSPSGAVEGGHETTIIAYNQQGVTVMNSWGSGWGNGGTYTLPWDFVNWGDLQEAHAMGQVVTSTPTPTTDPTTTPTDQPTSTPTEDPTDTPTEEPTSTPTEDPYDPWSDWGWDWSDYDWYGTGR